MTIFLFFVGISSIAYWLITGDADFYKIATGVLLILLGLFKEMTDFWKYEATRCNIISSQMSMDIDTIFGEGSADKVLSLAKTNALNHLKELKETGKEIPDVIREELEMLKAELENEAMTRK